MLTYLEQQNKPEGSYAFGVGVDATVESHRSLKASAPRLQPGTGVETVTFEVKQESKFETASALTADNGLVQAKAGYKQAWSKEITYELTVPATQAQRYQLKPQEAPDPFDVRSLPEGATLVIKVDDVRSSALEVEVSRTVGAIPSFEPAQKARPGEKASAQPAVAPNKVSIGGRFEPGGAQSTGRAVAIERVDDNTVRLLSGPSEGLKGTFALGGFVTDENGTFEVSGKVEAERSFSSQTQRAVELDLRKPGADQAYAYFLRYGTLPPAGHSAAVGTAEVYQTSFKTGGKLEGAGRYREGSTAVAVGTDYGVDEKRTFNSDGTVGNEFTVNDGDRTLQINKSYDASGKIDPMKTSTSYVVQGAPQEVAEGFQRSFHAPPAKQAPVVQGPQNLEVKLTQAEATQLSGIAQKYVADWENQNNQTFNPATQPLIWALATAASPDEVATSLIQAGGRHEDYRDLTELAGFHRASTGQQLPGEVSMKPAQ